MVLTTGNKDKMMGNTNPGRKVASGNDRQIIDRIRDIQSSMTNDNKTESQHEIKELFDKLTPEGKLTFSTTGVTT